MFEYLFDEKDDRRFQIVLSLNKLSRVDPKSWFYPRYNLKLESNFRLSWFWAIWLAAQKISANQSA